MRIGIVAQSYYPIRGGVPEHIHGTAQTLRKRGHTVTIITAVFNRGDENFNDGVIRIGHDLTVPLSGSFSNVTVGRNLGRQLRAIEERERFDVVHIHGPLEPVLPVVALKWMRAPKVGTFHTYKEKSIGYAFIGWYIRRYADRLAVRIAVSEAAKTFISQYFPGEYRIIPNGVDVERFNPHLAPIAAYDDDRPTILFVGRMDPRKGLKFLLLAFPAVVAAIPNARLVVVGGGILAGYYRHFMARTIANHVHFEGYASAEKLPRYYATADLYCSPATGNESFGIVLLEAMACGTPVVAFDNAGYRAVLADGRGGVLVPRRNIPALADSLIMLLRDPKRRAAMGREGRAKASAFSWEVITKQLEGVYEEAIRKHPA